MSGPEQFEFIDQFNQIFDFVRFDDEMPIEKIITSFKKTSTLKLSRRQLTIEPSIRLLK